MQHKIKLLLISFMILILLGIFSIISPIDANLLIYLAVFVLVYLLCFTIILFIVDIAYHHNDQSTKLLGSAILAFAPVTLLAIASLSALSLMDIVLTLSIPPLVVWYVYKRTKSG